MFIHIYIHITITSPAGSCYPATIFSETAKVILAAASERLRVIIGPFTSPWVPWPLLIADAMLKKMDEKH